MNRITRDRQTGLSLIEIMIALFIGLFLLLGLYQIFISTKQSYRLADGQSRLQENARYALETLNHDIRLAGYFGCSGFVDDTKPNPNPVVIANEPLIAPNAHPGNANVVSASIVTGGDNAPEVDALNHISEFTTPNPVLSVSPLNPVIKDTDAITIQFGESCGAFITEAAEEINSAETPMPASHSCGTITNGTATTLGTPLIVSDCNSAHIFRAAAASANTSQNKNRTDGGAISFLVTPTEPLGKTYRVGSEIMLFRSYTYFIRENPSRQPSLYRYDNNAPASSANPVEMVEGIENMQITYGIDTDADGSANQYDDSPADWTQVTSVRVVLTARSIDDNLIATPRSYNYNGAAVEDRRLVKTFSTTISLRNR